ncbi:hypothetical protein B0F90DRAFT_1322107 [Multifurca ochricompacta]|uniref:Uncharacterized protein n=1 Tax=Multifurca ochricompacta TaxID=376703 RepID=A0AAD4QPW0_9AGAM|nr:hypothetical protein B0F90DRAFT_1322107 [Multifurca ochricompacta]
MIDPTLLGKSFSHNSDLVDHSVDSTAAQWPITPTFPQSPIASTSSVFDPLTPREDFCSEPDVYRPEQDPICATTALLHMATPASLQATQSKPSAIVTATTTPTSSRAPSVALKLPTITQPAQALPLVNQKYLRTQTPLGNNALSKQEMIQRAKERRQQLLAELEKAKVELWEATIEQGVLIHLLKEEQHGRQ